MSPEKRRSKQRNRNKKYGKRERIMHEVERKNKSLTGFEPNEDIQPDITHASEMLEMEPGKDYPIK